MDEVFDGARKPWAGTAGGLLQFIRTGTANTRADLAAITGLARSTVTHRVDALIAEGLVYESGEGPSSGGRPPVMLAFNASAGAVLVADLGATHCRLAVLDLAATPLAEVAADFAIAEGPDRVLPWVAERFEDLLAEVGRTTEDLRGIGIGLPGPVEFAVGRAVNPPIMPGWDGVVVPEVLRERFDVPVLVDNDVNIMALGEYWTHWRDTVDDLLYVKVGTGIGCGIIAGGRVYRGAQGTAGDIGHIPLADHSKVLCRCGNRGCVEAIAGGAALAQQLTELGYEARGGRDVVQLVRAGNASAGRLVRDAGRLIGEVLVGVVNFFNPAVLVMGGDVSEADDQLLAGVREVVYQRSTVLATRSLMFRRSLLADRAGVTGAGVMVLEQVLAPGVINSQIASGAVAPVRSRS